MNMEKKSIGFELKELTEEGMFSGYGSTFGGEPDSHGDIVAKGAFANTLKNGGRNKRRIALLKQHDPDSPIGVWSKLEENDIGLYVEGKLALKTQDGHDSYELMKMGAFEGLSIGYTTKKFSYDQDKHIRTLEEIELWEISLVTFPANTNAVISNFKAIKEARTERDLENALRESGLSKSDSLYLVKLCKQQLRESVDDNFANELLKTLQEVNKKLIN